MKKIITIILCFCFLLGLCACGGNTEEVKVKENYVWYLPYIGNARSALYTANTTLFQKYLNEKSDTFVNTLRDKAPDDEEIIPQNNLLNTDGASDWSKGEIQRSAACNLLPYELSSDLSQ